MNRLQNPMKIFPDYSAGIAKGWNVDNTAEENGFVIIQTQASSAGYSYAAKVTINNNIVVTKMASNYGASSGVFSGYVKAGDIFRVDTQAVGTMTFYPLRA